MLRKLVITGFILGSTITLYGQVHRDGLSIKDTITDRELTIPEDIERNFDQLTVDWKTDMTPSLSCMSDSDGDVSFPDSVYIDRLYSLPTEMELVYNPIVRSYIDMYTGRMRKSVGLFLGKSDYYFPIFEQALDKYGLPLELKYLPIIESALNTTIVSRMGATGLWQFMIGTGKMYDLEVNSLVDERRDPLKSTEAAARYLKDLYNIYGDWNLVIAAYNCGPGNVNKAIRRSGGQTDYWEIYPYLPRETRGYVPAFIAATYVMNYYSEHNICPFEHDHIHSTDTIQIDRQLHLQQVADVLSLTIDDLRTLNPQYKKDIIPGDFKSYVLNLPSIKASEFGLLKDSIYSYRSSELLAHRKVVSAKGQGTSAGIGAKRYKVRRGDNLSSIAKRNGVTMTQIRRWNGLKSNKLKAGQTLIVSAGKTVKTTPSPTPVVKQSSTKALAQTKDSTVPQTNTSDDKQSSSNLLSEYFARIEKKSTETDTLSLESNNAIEKVESLVADMITPNASRKLENRNRDIQRQQTIYHKVRIGETLTQIATKYNVDRKDISSWNKIKSSVPKVGQRLVIHLPAKIVKDEDDESAADVLGMSNLSTNEENIEEQSVVAYASLEKNEIHEPEDAKGETEKTIDTKPTIDLQKKMLVHVVKKGDTLGHIAAVYGRKLTAKDIRKANNLRSDRLSIGQKLKIPR